MALVGVSWLAAGLTTVFAGGCKPEPLPEEVRSTIGPDGGQLSSSDGTLTLFFPPGALGSAVEVVISSSDTPPEAFGESFRVQPDLDLDVPVEVTYRGDLPADPAMATVGAVRRDAFEAGDGTWDALPRIELDVANGVVTSTDVELSLFYTLLDEGGGVAGTTTEGGMSTTTGTTGDPSDPTLPTGGETTGDDSGGPLSHATDIQPIWTQNCVTGCHEPGGLYAALSFAGDAYDAIVGRPSLVATVNLIEPGSAATSYLMHKIDGTYSLDTNLGGCGCGGSGTLMPQGASEPLDIAIRDKVRAWINEGALR